MKLTRTDFRPDGIFGMLHDDSGKLLSYTLEHSYAQLDGSWLPKLNAGQHSCVRGPHRLHNMTQDFETFEITGVPGHSNILFHWGNFDRDSEGCVLLGNAIVSQPDGTEMVVNSRHTFAEFLKALTGINQFILTVVDRK